MNVQAMCPKFHLYVWTVEEKHVIIKDTYFVLKIKGYCIVILIYT